MPTQTVVDFTENESSVESILGYLELRIRLECIVTIMSAYLLQILVKRSMKVCSFYG